MRSVKTPEDLVEYHVTVVMRAFLIGAFLGASVATIILAAVL